MAQLSALDECLSILKYSTLLKIEKLRLEVQIRLTKQLINPNREKDLDPDCVREISAAFSTLCKEGGTEAEVEKLLALLRDVNTRLSG